MISIGSHVMPAGQSQPKAHRLPVAFGTTQSEFDSSTYDYGLTWFDQKEYAKAVRAFNFVLNTLPNTNPNCPFVKTALGIVYLVCHQDREAETLWKDALQSLPNTEFEYAQTANDLSAALHYNLGMMQWKVRNNPRAARQHFIDACRDLDVGVSVGKPLQDYIKDVLHRGFEFTQLPVVERSPVRWHVISYHPQSANEQRLFLLPKLNGDISMQ